MDEGVKQALFAAIIVVLLGGMALLYQQTVTLEDKLEGKSSALAYCEDKSAALEKSGQELEVQKNACGSVLSATKAELADTTQLKDSEISSLSGSLGVCVGEKRQLEAGLKGFVSELDSYEQKTAASMAWFSRNSDLGNFQEYAQLKLPVESHCSRVQGGVCTIRLPCIPFVNEDQGLIRYEKDRGGNASADHLQSLDQTFASKGGDCEDLALLFSAELAFLVGECGKKTNSIVFEAMAPSPDSYYEIAYGWDWIYRNYKGKDLDSERTHFYTVCGLLPADFDPNSGKSGLDPATGHCVTAFTGKEIKSKDDVQLALEDSFLVEPQTGVFLADLRSDGTVVVPEDGSSLNYSLPYLSMVITGNDLYDFDRTSRQWKSYAYFLQKIGGLKAVAEGLASVSNSS